MPASQLSIATFNLYNLNRPGLRMYRDPDGWTQDQYDKKIEWTARMLKQGDADVWGFQEHWHNDALTEAVEHAGLETTHTLLMPAGHTGQKIQCAALVRNEMLQGDPEWITTFPEGCFLRSSGEDEQTPSIELEVNAFSRPVLNFMIKPARSKDAIRVFVCHFKSKAPTRVSSEDWYKRDPDLYKAHQSTLGSALSTIRRTAEAAALRVILNDYLKVGGQPAVVLGDLNDGIQSNTLNIMTAQPTFLLDGRASEGSDVGLYSVSTMLQLRSERDVYYSHIYKNRMETLDHILVSEELYDLSRDREWGFAGAEIINDHLNREDHKETGTGDHGIVRARFTGRSSLR